mmetsp:Transcript_6690/g.17497  ORF Transcript_6690/g.17497 Transcript_6690/m.17497 type:complete len:147 (-) Transcript_6690:284-724(-)
MRMMREAFDGIFAALQTGRPKSPRAPKPTLIDQPTVATVAEQYPAWKGSQLEVADGGGSTADGAAVSARAPRVGHPSRRQNFTPEQTAVLMNWFQDHLIDPYPKQDEKLILAQQTGIEVRQVEHWFTNKRKRNWRHTDTPLALVQQ